MAKVTLFFKAINKDEHLVVVLAKGARVRADNCAKRPVGRPRPSAETPPVPNIDRASEILRLSDDVGQEAKRIRCQYSTKQKMHVVMRADLITQISAPQCRRPLAIRSIRNCFRSNTRRPLALELFLAAPIL